MLEFELIGGGDDSIPLGDEKGLDVGFHQADEMEGCFDVLSSLLNPIDQGGCLRLLVLDHGGECCGLVSFVLSSSHLAEAADRDITLDTKQIP